jgi:hypothetical protein
VGLPQEDPHAVTDHDTRRSREKTLPAPSPYRFQLSTLKIISQSA